MDFTKSFVQKDSHFRFWGWMKIAAFAKQKGDSSLYTTACESAIKLTDFNIPQQETYGVAFEECRSIAGVLEAHIKKSRSFQYSDDQLIATMSRVSTVVLESYFLNNIPLGASFLSNEFDENSLLQILTTKEGMNLDDSHIMATESMREQVMEEYKKLVVLRLFDGLSSVLSGITKYAVYLLTGMVCVEIGIFHSKDDYSDDKKSTHQEYLCKSVENIVKHNTVA